MIKKVWVTKNCERMYSITLESKYNESPIGAYASVFPSQMSDTQNQRHTLKIGLFDIDDLLDIRDTINEFLQRKE
jgi:hypothetical protein